MLRDFKEKNKTILFESVSKNKYFGYCYYGILLNRPPDNNLLLNDFFKKQSEHNSIYYCSKKMLIQPTFLCSKYLIPLQTKWIALYCFKIRYDSSFESDSTMLAENTNNEINSTATMDNYSLNNQKKQNQLYDSINGMLYSKSYLTPIADLKRLKPEAIQGDVLKSFYYQSLATLYSFIGELQEVRNTNAEYYHSLQQTNTGNESVPVITSQSLDTSFQKLYSIANNTQVLMINESHYDWRHRYFTSLLLDTLYKIGYRYLCLEDMSYKKATADKPYPTKESGFYVKEPYMANLIRIARNIGYTLIPYEDTSKNTEGAYASEIDKREFNQAKNLYSAFKKDSLAKWLVFSGYSHINKQGFTKTQKSMGQYFQDFSQARTVAVNQTKYSDLFGRKYLENDILPGYYIINDNAYIDNNADIYVVNNIDAQPYQDTVSNNGFFIKYDLKKEFASLIKKNIYLFVYLANEYAEANAAAIPVFISKVDNLKAGYLFLPENRYTLVLLNADEEVIYNRELQKYDH